MFCSLAPPQLCPMIDHHKMMCNTSKYFQEFKIMKDKADNSRGREKDYLTQAYKSYAEYVFPNDETCHPRCKNAKEFLDYHRICYKIIRKIPDAGVRHKLF